MHSEFVLYSHSLVVRLHFIMVMLKLGITKYANHCSSPTRLQGTVSLHRMGCYMKLSGNHGLETAALKIVIFSNWREKIKSWGRECASLIRLNMFVTKTFELVLTTFYLVVQSSHF